MLVQCPRCQTKWNLDKGLLDPDGSTVRCSRCQHEFTVHPPAEAPPAQPDDDLMDFLEETGPAAVDGFDEEMEKTGRGGLISRILLTLAVTLVAIGLVLGLAGGGILFLKSRGTHLDQDYLKIDLYDYLPYFKPKPGSSPGALDQAPAPQDPGNKRIMLSEVEGGFLSLPFGEKLFVIRGKITNNYGHPISEVKLKGLLHSRGQRNAAEASTFAGHVLDDEELTSLSRSVISELLSRPEAGDGTKPTVEPGQGLEFLIVFFDLPQDLVEFTVEVVSSQPLAGSGKG